MEILQREEGKYVKKKKGGKSTTNLVPLRRTNECNQSGRATSAKSAEVIGSHRSSIKKGDEDCL